MPFFFQVFIPLTRKMNAVLVAVSVIVAMNQHYPVAGQDYPSKCMKAK